MNNPSPSSSPSFIRLLTSAILSYTLLMTPLVSVAAADVRAGVPAARVATAKAAAAENPARPSPAPAPEEKRAAAAAAAVLFAPPSVVSASMTASVSPNDGDGGKIDPADTVTPGSSEKITYTATLSNNSPTDATNLFFSVPLDVHTTLVPNSLNSTPVAFDQIGASTVTTNEDTPVTFNIEGQDPDGSDASHMLAFRNPTTHAVLTGSVPAAHGTLNFAGTVDCTSKPGFCKTSVTYTPAANYNGPDGFTFEVNDGTANSNEIGTISINVLGVNDQPTFTQSGGNQTVNEDAGAQSVAGFITAISPGPADESGQTVSFVVTNDKNSLFSSQPSIDSAGKLNYTPAPNQNGVATVSYHAHDSGGTANGGVDNNPNAPATDLTFTITVNAVNDKPVVTPPSGIVVHANMKRLNLGGLLANITDADTGVSGCAPTFAIKNGSISGTSPAGGTISNVNLTTGTFEFDPPPGVTNQNVTFTYVVTDTGCPGTADSDPVTVTIAVQGPVIWFVNPALASDGDGRLSSPFKFLQSAAVKLNSLAPNQRVFVYAGTTTEVMNIPGGQPTTNTLALTGTGTQATAHWLIGGGALGSDFDTLMGLTAPAGVLANTITRPSINGTRPTIQSTVLMKDNTVLRGLNVSVTGSARGITNNSNVIPVASTIEISDVNVTSASGNAVEFSSGGTVNYTGSNNNLTSTTGIALSLVNTTIGGSNFNFKSINAGTAGSGPSSGIVLNNTGALGSLIVVGGGSVAQGGDGSGGTIQKTGSHGISLTNTRSPSFNNIKVLNTAGTGIKGSGNVVNFTLTNSTLQGNGDPAGAANLSNVGFNDSSGGTEKNLTGTVVITNNILNTASYHGVDILNFDGTIDDANISNNLIVSGTTTGTGGTSFGSGIRFAALGSASTHADVTKATINANDIQNFPGGSGIVLNGGNANSSGGAPATVMGTAGHATNKINVTNNFIKGNSAVNRLAFFAIQASVNGRGQGNFNISNNGTAAKPITNVTGNVISHSSFGFANVTSTIANNVIVANHTAGVGGGFGISVGVVKALAVSDTPSMTTSVTGNNVSGTDGSGIFARAGEAQSTLNITLKNNTVAAPLSGVRPGIQVLSGNSDAGSNATLCLDISGNTSAGSGGTQGIGLRKQGTSTSVNIFGIKGMSATASPNVENFVNGQNPAGGGTLLISATSGFSNCSTSPDAPLAPNAPVTAADAAPKTQQQTQTRLLSVEEQRALVDAQGWQTADRPAIELGNAPMPSSGPVSRLDKFSAPFVAPLVSPEAAAPAADRAATSTAGAAVEGTTALAEVARVETTQAETAQPEAAQSASAPARVWSDMPAGSESGAAVIADARANDSAQDGVGIVNASYERRDPARADAPVGDAVATNTAATAAPETAPEAGDNGAAVYALMARSLLAVAFFSGETVNVSGLSNTGFTLPAACAACAPGVGKTVTVTFQATLNNPPNFGSFSATQAVKATGTLTGAFAPGTATTGEISTPVDLFDTKNTLTSVPSSGSLNSGESVTFTAKVEFDNATTPAPNGVDPGGTVNFFDGANPIAGCSGVALSGPSGNRTATCTTSFTTTGSPHSVTATYNGDGNFDPKTSAADVKTISKSDTTTAVTSSKNPSNVNDSVTFTATVASASTFTGTPTGTVDFFLDGSATPISGCDDAPLSGAGKATCTTTFVAAATHSITATYSGDTNFNTSNNNATPFQQEVKSCSANPVVTSTADSGANTLREAVNNICPAPDNTITFNLAAGAHIKLTSGELLVNADVIINGPGASLLTVERDTATQFRIFEVAAGKTAKISGMTIANGHAPDGPAGLPAVGTTGTSGTNGTDGTPNGVAGLNGGAGTDGTSGGTGGAGGAGSPGENGGGILNNGTLTLDGVVVSGNVAGNGGAGGNGGQGGVGGNGGNGGAGGAALLPTDPNTNGGAGGNAGTGGSGGAGGNGGAGGQGGGIFNAGILTLTNSTVNGNETGAGGAAGTGGAVGAAGTPGTGGAAGTGGTGTGTAGANGVVAGPTPSAGANGTGGLAGSGGGIANTGTAKLALTNVTISGNRAHVDGGGLYNQTGDSTLVSVTVTGNTADNDNNATGTGGGINVAGGTVVLRNTIVAGNLKGMTSPTADDIAGTVDSTSSFNLVGDSATSGGLIDVSTDTAHNNKVGNAGSGTVDITTVLNTTLATNSGQTLTHFLVDNSPAIDTGTSVLATLGEDITDTVTPKTFAVSDSTIIPVGLVIRVDSEQMLVTAKPDGQHVTVTRAVNSTAAATHTSGVGVYSLNSTTDQRGFTRPVDFVVNTAPGDESDIGAFERQNAPPPPAIALNAGSKTGTSNTIISDTSPTFDISNVVVGATVVLLRDATPVSGASVVAGSTTVQLTDNSGTSDATTYSYTAKQTFVGLESNPSTTPASVTIDTTAPTIMVSAPSVLSANAGTGSVTFTVTYADTNLDAITLGAGNITLNTSGTANAAVGVSGTGNTRTVTLSSLSGVGTLGISIAAATATDLAGNAAPAAGPSATFTVDTVLPTVVMTSAAANPTTVSPIPVTVTFSESVTGFTASDITASNGTVGNFAGSGANYTFDLTPAGQGNVSANIGAGVATDAAGNGNTAAVQFNRVFDTAAPTVSITAVSPDPRNTSVSSIQIVFSKAVTGFDLGDLSLKRDGGSNLLTGAQTLTTGDNTTYTLNNLGGLTGTAGTYLLTLTAPGGIADAASNPLSAGATETWVVDTTVPTVVSLVATSPDPTTGPTSSTVINFTITFSERVFNFDGADVNIATGPSEAGATVANVTEIAPLDGTTYNLAVGGMTKGGTVTVSVPANAATDAAGNATTASGTATVNFIPDNFAAFVVNTTADTTDGSCDPLDTNDASKNCTLREAIAAADADFGAETITFDPTVFAAPGPHTINLTGVLPDISSSMTIDGPGANVLTVKRDTGGDYRVFNITAANNDVTIEGLTISGGNVVAGGAGEGGGIRNASTGTVNVANCAISGNASDFEGGGLFNAGTGTLNVTGSTFSGNSATGNGGGLWLASGTVNITDSTVSGNTSTGNGGGLANAGATATISNSTVTDNRADNDTNGSGAGGGLAVSGGTTTLRSTIVAGNFNDASPSTTADDISGTVAAASSFNLIGAGGSGGLVDLSTDPAHQNQVGVSDAVLRPLALNGGTTQTHALQCTSPAIDKGNAFGQATDQRGLTRVFDLADTVFPNAAGGDGTDIGALETQSGGGCLPAALAPAPSTNEDTQSGDITLTGTYAQNTPLSFFITQTPANGTLTALSAPVCNYDSLNTLNTCTATLKYTPALNFNGADTFKFKVSTGSLDSESADVNVTVNPVNDAPTASSNSATTDEDVPLGITLLGSDVEGSPLTFTVVTNPAHGTLSGTAPNLTYTPDLNYNGTDSFTFRTNDGSLNSTVATIAITIDAVNDAPVGVNDTYDASENTPLSVAAAAGVIKNDTDVENQTLTAVLFASPTHAAAGSFKLNPDGSFNYTPQVGFVGDDTFTYRATDSSPLNNFSNLVTVTIKVKEGGLFQFSAATFSEAEDTGTATITVTRTGGSAGAASVNYATAAGGTAAGAAACGAGVDFVTTSGTLNWADGETASKTFAVTLCNDSLFELSKTVNLALTGAGGSGDLGALKTAVLTITDGDAPGGVFGFGQAVYAVGERDGFATITVTRTGDTTRAANVDYTTDDGADPHVPVLCSATTGAALERCDYTASFGTLRFAVGETSKTFVVLVTDDSYTEGSETTALKLTNPTNGGALSLAGGAVASLQIQDDVPESVGNRNDDAESFVTEHYHDFLGRHPDPAGLAFWTQGITSCGADEGCREVKRLNTSAAFFLSIEFQNTGFYAYRVHKAAFGDTQGTFTDSNGVHQIDVPSIRLGQFLRDSRAVGQDVVVGVGNWQAQIEANKRALALEVVQRPEFMARYPAVTSATAFVASLDTNTGGVLTDQQRSNLIQQLSANPGDPNVRAEVLRTVAETEPFQLAEKNKAFVLMQYFGYLRRNPNDAPEAGLDYSGYIFWLNKLNQFNGNFIQAEMVKAFLDSIEYRQRFGQ